MTLTNIEKRGGPNAFPWDTPYLITTGAYVALHNTVCDVTVYSRLIFSPR